MRVTVLQHVPFEGPGHIADWVAARGHQLRIVRLFAGDPVPSLDDFGSLVIMGGPMSVNDEAEFPWLVAEKRLTAAAIAAGKPLLGVCLGAQMIASALGAKVYRNTQREIGWMPVQQIAGVPESFLTPLPTEFMALHWHGETFDLPAGAVHLASTTACRNQAIQYGSALGLQFHIEISEAGLTALVANCAGEISAGPYQQSTETILAGQANCQRMRGGLYAVLDRWARS